MSIKHDLIDVSVSQQFLWIDNDAYPLKGITRVGYGKWTPPRWSLVQKSANSVFRWWLIGFVLTAVLHLTLKKVTHSSTPAPELLFLLLATGLVPLTLFKAVGLFKQLFFTYYILYVQTAGSSITALSSRDETVVRDLAELITDAINNPAAEFHLKVDNFHLGDNITQHGDRAQVNK